MSSLINLKESMRHGLLLSYNGRWTVDGGRCGRSGERGEARAVAGEARAVSRLRPR